MLTNRQLQILRVIVDDFISSGQPVGSRQIAKKDEVTFSSATIRNEMADLEELGYIEKTHSSSGRVPSEKGYRFYVDHLLKPQVMTNQEIASIRSIFRDDLMENEQMIRESANILSELTTYTSVILGPDVHLHKVKRFQIVPLSSTQAVAIIVTNNGHVENRVFTLPEGYDLRRIEKIVNILNDRLVGRSLEEVPFRVDAEIRKLIQEHVGQYGEFISSLFGSISAQDDGRIYYGGKTNMLNQPEFHDINKVRMLLDIMEKKPQVQTLFQANSNEGIQIKIGSENNLLAIEDCSIITASFNAGNNQHGSIAIIGPKRMDYQRVITLLDFMSGDLSRLLSNNM